MKTIPPECADKIKSMVSMRDVAELYGLNIDPRSSKARCPFHNDTKPSMQVYPGSRGYYCFVCGTGGDVINFVQRYFGLNFLNACRKLNDDFQLGLIVEGWSDAEARRASERAYIQRLEKKRREEAKLKQLETVYDSAIRWYSFLDILMEESAPTDENEPISPDYVFASKRIDAAWQDVVDAENALRRFREENGAA